MPDLITLNNLEFEPLLSEAQIQQRVAEMGREIQADYPDQPPFFLVMLKGAFIFAADLIRATGLASELGFVRASSYVGTNSTRTINLSVPPEPSEVAQRDIILVEDIVDSGHTMHQFLPRLWELQPRSVRLATLLYKPDAMEVEVPVDYIGFTISPEFVIGYGLDYDGQGRQLRAIYRKKD